MIPNKNLDEKTLDHMLQKAVRACRSRGLRMTPQRLEVYKEIAASFEHPDAETLFRRIQQRWPKISLDTIYRTLATLEEIGLLTRIDTPSGRARYDANQLDHHHFVCKKCNAVLDIYLDEDEKLDIPQMSTSLGEVESAHLQVRGVCTSCRDSSQ